jgi:hypothetical protein
MWQSFFKTVMSYFKPQIEDDVDFGKEDRGNKEGSLFKFFLFHFKVKVIR